MIRPQPMIKGFYFYNMARPKKNNADYFSHDADMRNDNKIKALRRKFKVEGYGIWCMLIEHLTDTNHFKYEYNDFNLELLSGDFDVNPILLKEIIEYCILLKLLVNKDGYIYSQKLIDRFESLLNKRKRDVKPLIDELSTSITPQIDIIDVENPQSKVKESKVDEIIEDKKYNNAYDFLKLHSKSDLDVFEMQNKNSFDNYNKFIDYFNNKVIFEEIEFTSKKLMSRLRMLNVNWNKQPKTKQNKKPTNNLTF